MLKKRPMVEDVDYFAVASMTDGMVGAELANIVEVAAINMMRHSRTEGISPIEKDLIVTPPIVACILLFTAFHSGRLLLMACYKLHKWKKEEFWIKRREAWRLGSK
ncbi:hypothetical protein S83_032901 [Arachis hypogaea]|nr:putative inactive ATP-dependent zinc metalloprotease FTSHI 2 [Arachis hypogaea]